MKINTALSVCIVAGGMLGGVSFALADEVKLKAASFVPTQTSWGWPFARWVDAVNDRCDGQLEVSIVGPEAIKAFEQPNALKTGVIDMMSGPPAYYVGTLPEGDTLSLSEVRPSTMRENGAWAMLDTLHQDKLNAKLLTFFGDETPFFLWTTKEAPKGSFEGFTLRTSPLYNAFFQGLGANTTTMPPPQVYTALERGTVDGMGWPLWGVVGDFSWHDYLKYRYGPGFFNVAVSVLINKDVYDGLDAQQQQCLDQMALWAEEVWPQWKAEKDQEVLSKLDEAGIKYVDLGEEFRLKAHNLYWGALLKESPDNVAKLKSLLTK